MKGLIVKLAGLAIISVAILVVGKMYFERIPKPNYTNDGAGIACETTPSFLDYPVEKTGGPVTIPIDFKSNSRAKIMEEEILAATPSGVNFAGKYMLVKASCGVDCENHAVIDSASGGIVGFGFRSMVQTLYKPDSNLIQIDNTYYTFNSSGLNYLCEK